MHVIVELTGQSPLLMHNPRLADPMDPIVRAMKMVTDKRKKTDADRDEISKLEWYGGLYANGDGPYLPTGNFRKCIIETARARRLGKTVERGFVPRGSEAPLIYDGPRNIDQLWEIPKFRHRAMVGNQRNRIPRVRPQFVEWQVVVEGEVLEDILSVEDFADLVTTAGIIEGLGDNRVNGYGRFSAVVKVS